jgi:peptidoglycan hydrolase CwlO-like protein
MSFDDLAPHKIARHSAFDSLFISLGTTKKSIRDLRAIHYELLDRVESLRAEVLRNKSEIRQTNRKITSLAQKINEMEPHIRAITNLFPTHI